MNYIKNSRKGTKMKKKLNLEILEDRCTPATLLWRPSVSNFWQDNRNWIDRATNTNPVNPPLFTDDCIFDQNSGLNCLIRQSVDCQSISSNNWNGSVDDSGGTLNVDGGNSSWTRGSFDCPTQVGVLNINGGNFTYTAAKINGVANAQQITVYVQNLGGLTFGPGWTDLGITFLNVGTSAAVPHADSTGTVFVSGTTGFSANSNINVSPKGWLKLNTNAKLMSCAGLLVNGGNLTVDNSTITMLQGRTLVLANGAYFYTGNTGTSTINGDMRAVIGSNIYFGRQVGNYVVLTVNGTLTLDSGELDMKVNGDTLGGNGNSDHLIVNNLVLNNETLELATDTNIIGQPMQGNHSYEIITATPGGISGEFSAITYGGGWNWIVAFDYLMGTVTAEGTV